MYNCVSLVPSTIITAGLKVTIKLQYSSSDETVGAYHNNEVLSLNISLLTALVTKKKARHWKN